MKPKWWYSQAIKNWELCLSRPSLRENLKYWTWKDSDFILKVWMQTEMEREVLRWDQWFGSGFLLLPDTLQPPVKWSGRSEGLKGARGIFWRWYVHSLDCSDCSPYVETYQTVHLSYVQFIVCQSYLRNSILKRNGE